MKQHLTNGFSKKQTKKMSMEQTQFTVTKEMQQAEAFGLVYFPNGYSRQIVYNVYQDGRHIKQHISTKFNDNLYALIIIGHKAINGIEIIPAQEIVYDVKFSKNAVKKAPYGTRFFQIQSL